MKYYPKRIRAAAANSLPSADFVIFVNSILFHVKLANPIKRGV